MAKLVVLTAGMTGRTHELKADKTTVGRLEDNTFQIAEPSVSSHHCEVLLQGSEVLVRDLNSTNGTFINGEKISESILKPGQTLRLGQIELRLEAEGAGAATAPAPSPSPSPAPSPTRKPLDQTLATQRGVSLSELDQGTRPTGFDTKGTGFSKKDNKANKIIWIIAGAVGLVIVALLLYVFAIASSK
jgi:pSer/pThr/pTyr-binding forkhead associated (FHA) protein